MLKYSLYIIPILIAASCSNAPKEVEQTKTNQNDTVVGNKVITDEKYGAQLREISKSFFMVYGADTSNFACMFSISKEGYYVGCNTRILNDPAKVSYTQKMRELKSILPVAAKEFNFDSMKSIVIGNLMMNGDLCIDVSREFFETYGDVKEVQATYRNYSQFEAFLMASKMGKDINELMQPYGLKLENIGIEKLHLLPKAQLYVMNKIESDTSQVPNKVFDCMLYVQLSKI